MTLFDELGITGWEKTSINNKQIIKHPRIKRSDLKAWFVSQIKKIDVENDGRYYNAIKKQTITGIIDGGPEVFEKRYMNDPIVHYLVNTLAKTISCLDYRVKRWLMANVPISEDDLK